MQEEGESYPEKIEHSTRTQSTLVVEGEEDATKLSMQTLSQIESVLCACGDRGVPSTLLEIQSLREKFRDLRQRKVKVRYITDITTDNIQNCKQLIQEFGFELRYLAEIKGNFAIADLTRQYWAGARIHRSYGDTAQLVWSDVPAIVEQNQHIFDLLWDSAIPAEIRFREIEEGIPRYETRILKDPNQIVLETKRMIDSSRRYSVSSLPGGLLYARNYVSENLKRILDKSRRGEHEGIRWITIIDETNLEAAKEFLECGMLIRHLDNVPTESFGISQKEVGVTISRIENGSLNNSALFSNDPMYAEHYAGVFEDLWKSSMDAQLRIKEIEEGVEEPQVRIIRNRGEVQDLFLQLLGQAKEEILLLLPSSNSYRRQVKIGIVDSMRSAVVRGVKIKMLAPTAHNVEGQLKGIEFKAIREATGLNTVIVLVVDKMRSLIIEQQDDSKDDFVEAVGIATYSSRGSAVKANIRFFERMWEEIAEREREETLLEKERRSRVEAELFQDILTHDIRNYNQAARLNAELLEEELGSTPPDSLRSYLDSVINSIDGSTRLVERASKFGKILAEGDSARLLPVSLLETIDSAEEVVKKSMRGKKISFERPADLEGKFVMADEMLQEVFLNLFSNSVKYSDQNDVRIELKVQDTEDGYYKISIIDHGHGIPIELKSDLFTRYLKSARGSGLGLSIAHALVSERYHGKIVAKDRIKGDSSQGTIMEFLIPKAPDSH